MSSLGLTKLVCTTYDQNRNHHLQWGTQKYLVKVDAHVLLKYRIKNDCFLENNHDILEYLVILGNMTEYHYNRASSTVIIIFENTGYL